MITIHNVSRSVWISDKLHYLPTFDLIHVSLLEWDHCINSLVAGMQNVLGKCLQSLQIIEWNKIILQTVLESLFKIVRNKSVGILNGIDTGLGPIQDKCR
jgi:starch synthase